MHTHTRLMVISASARSLLTCHRLNMVNRNETNRICNNKNIYFFLHSQLYFSSFFLLIWFNSELGNCNYPKYKYLLKDSFKYILVLAITFKKFGHTCICTCTCGRIFLPLCKYFSRSFQLLLKYLIGLKKNNF